MGQVSREVLYDGRAAVVLEEWLHSSMGHAGRLCDCNDSRQEQDGHAVAHGDGEARPMIHAVPCSDVPCQ